MEKFLIEVPHSTDQNTCLMAVKIFLSSGSHYLINADWGCRDGVHKSWLTIEADSKHDALLIVPPAFRKDAIITQLNRFRIDEIDDLISKG